MTGSFLYLIKAFQEPRDEFMDEIRMRFKKYGHHIRVLRAQWDIVIEAASVSCIHLKSLHLQPSQTYRVNEPETWAAYPGASEAAEVARVPIAIAIAKREARRAAGIEEYCTATVAAAATPRKPSAFRFSFQTKKAALKQ